MVKNVIFQPDIDSFYVVGIEADLFHIGSGFSYSSKWMIDLLPHLNGIDFLQTFLLQINSTYLLYMRIKNFIIILNCSSFVGEHLRPA